jgi:TolA-binding protein
MKRLILTAVVPLVVVGCAHLQGLSGDTSNRQELWSRAHEALSDQDFAGAEAAFGQLAREHSGTIEARESEFYLGAMRLDPRNDDWDPLLAQERLDGYLAHVRDGGPRLYRYPEALTLHEIARQLNLPPDSRVEGLQPEERVVTVQERVLVPAEQSQELAAEVEHLRQQIAERDERIHQQQEELERIRRTLTAPARP